MDPKMLAAWLDGLARAAGLSRVAFASVNEVKQHEFFLAWLRADHAGEMTYLHRDAAMRKDPRSLLSAARTIVCAALSYLHMGLPAEAEGGLRAQIARYARGEDYHLVLKRRLGRFAERISEGLGRPVLYRVCVDSAPLLERALGAQAGLGFQGKNTLLITPQIGSYTVLGELLLDIEVAPGEPMAPRCGRCSACITACPTGALIEGYLLDARRCISYLTIEHRGPIPRHLRPLMGAWVFGCDLCQEACPYNAAEKEGDPAFLPRRELLGPDLRALLEIGSAQHRRLVRRTALRRVSRHQLQRNAAVALGNVGGPAEVAPLARALDPSLHPALVRQHVAWALGHLAQRHPTCAARVRGVLARALAGEEDEAVRTEITSALDEGGA